MVAGRNVTKDRIFSTQRPGVEDILITAISARPYSPVLQYYANFLYHWTYYIFGYYIFG